MQRETSGQGNRAECPQIAPSQVLAINSFSTKVPRLLKREEIFLKMILGIDGITTKNNEFGSLSYTTYKMDLKLA